MKLSTLVKKLTKHQMLWEKQGWGDPVISEIIVDHDFSTIVFCARKVFDKKNLVTVHKKPSTYITLMGKF